MVTEAPDKKGYKRTIIGVIPRDWEIKRMAEVGEIKMCRRVFNHETKTIGAIPFYKIGTFGKEADAYISQDLYDNYRRKFSFPQKGSILISAAGTIGRTIVYDGQPAYFQDSNIIWIDNNESIVFNKYLYYVFQIAKYQTEGGTIQRLYNNILYDTKFICPPKSEQPAITSALSDTDALIENLRKLIAKKRDITTAAMQQLLTGKKRLPGFSGEWTVKLLPDISWFQEGPGVRTTQFTQSGVKLLNGTNIYRGSLYLDSTNRFISSAEAYGAYSHFLVDEGDIVIASSGITIDTFEEKIAFVKKEHLPLCMNTSTIRFKVRPKSLDAQYLFFFLMSKKFKDQIGAQATGSAQLNFGPSHVDKVEVPLPSVPEQVAIASVLLDMDKEVVELEMRLQKTLAVKQGMLRQLLTGNISLV